MNMLKDKKVEGKSYMQKKKLVIKKFIATMIIFLLTMLDMMPILNNLSFAVENEEDAVEVKAYFSSENVENTDSLDCDVNEKNTNLNFEIKVNGKGYLKSGILKLGDNLNFSIKDNSDVKIKDNQIKVQALNQSESQKISIPIEYVRKNSMTSTYLSKTNQVTFSGIYVDNEGKEQKLEKVLNAKLSWKEQTSTNLEYNVIKNINYEKDGIKGKIQHGSAWWFNDHKLGMEAQIKSLANLGMLSTFIGMLTDSRSFLSYTRHEYFRRIMCELIGGWVENGEYPNDEKALKKIVEGISYNNAVRYFGFDL